MAALETVLRPAVNGCGLPRGAFALPLRKADADGFAPFGQLVAVQPGAGRAALPLRRTGAAGPEGEPTLNLITLPGRPEGPLNKPRIERHPYSVQAFIPLGSAPLVAVVAAAELERPRARDLHAFRVCPGQCVILDEGTWHLGMASDGAPMPAVVFIHRLADGRDTEIRPLDADLILAPEARDD